MTEVQFICSTKHIVKMRAFMGERIRSVPTRRLASLKQHLHNRGLAGLLDLFRRNPLIPDIKTYVLRNLKRRQIRFPAIFDNPVAPLLYALFATPRARLAAALLSDEFKKDPKACILVFNGYLMPDALSGVLADRMKRRKIVLEKGFFPHTLQCDPNGINFSSTLPRSPEFYHWAADRIAGGLPTELVQRAPKRQGGERGALPEKYIFVPFQVPSDMQILEHSPWIKDMRHFHGIVVSLAEALPHLHFVIKEHPSFPLSLTGTVKDHPRISFANLDETRGLIERSDGVITVNSTVGMESLLLGKRVITLGNAPYNLDGLVLPCGSVEEIAVALNRLEQWSPDETLRTLFLRYVYNVFLIHGDPFEPDEPLIRAIQDRAGQQDLHSTLLKQFAEMQMQRVSPDASRH